MCEVEIVLCKVCGFEVFPVPSSWYDEQGPIICDLCVADYLWHREHERSA